MISLATTFNVSADSKLVSFDFPGVRWGFSTVNFLPHMPVGVESSKAHINLAKSLGLAWIELRDPDAVLTPGECRVIADHARGNGIEVNYSAQRGLLAPDFQEVFERALANTVLFDGPRTIRVLALRGSGDKGWSDEEFERATKVANEGARRAAAAGLRFAVENANVVLEGQGLDCHGMSEFFSSTEPEVLLQLDTANLFTGPLEPSPQEAAEFIRTVADRVAYVHLKSARGGKALPVIEDNPLGFHKILEILADRGAPPVALELASAENADAVSRNIRQSLKNLVAGGLLRPSGPVMPEAP